MSIGIKVHVVWEEKLFSDSLFFCLESLDRPLYDHAHLFSEKIIYFVYLCVRMYLASASCKNNKKCR